MEQLLTDLGLIIGAIFETIPKVLGINEPLMNLNPKLIATAIGALFFLVGIIIKYLNRN